MAQMDPPESDDQGAPASQEEKRRKTIPGRATMAWAQAVLVDRQAAKQKQRGRGNYSASGGGSIRAVVFVATLLALFGIGLLARVLTHRPPPPPPTPAPVAAPAAPAEPLPPIVPEFPARPAQAEKPAAATAPAPADDADQDQDQGPKKKSKKHHRSSHKRRHH